MLFNSLDFLFVFLPITYAVFWMTRARQVRYGWLTLASYVFYGYWDVRFTALLAFSTLVSYTCGLGMLRWIDPHRRRLLLVVSVSSDLALLGFFKYGDFALGSLESALGWIGGDATLPRLGVILPVGISFYTFQTISYAVDCYRGEIRPTRNLLEFASYASLFSQLVAGPIIRFKDVREDFDQLDHAERRRWLSRGLSFLGVGLIQKVLIADSLAAFVDPALAEYAALSTMGAWLAMLGYTFQLYFDFAGYSTMAVGLGYLFGIRIPQNFNSPYKALDPRDFWRRWHISLSTFLRDYLYVPLGGNRRGPAITYRNLLLVMLLGGLWHGAGWTFVVWGGYHGLLLAAHHRWGVTWDRFPAAMRRAVMFLAAVVGWVFFRSTDFTMAASLLQTMFSPTPGTLVPQASLAATMLALSGAWALGGRNAFEFRHEWRWWGRLAIAGAFGACVGILAGGRPSPFLYFQF